MRRMFGISPEGVLYTNDGYSPSFMKKMVDISRPFRALVTWLRHFIPLHGMLLYYALSGLSFMEGLAKPCMGEIC